MQNRTLFKILIEPHASPHSLSTCNVAGRGNATANKIVGRQTTTRLGNSQVVMRYAVMKGVCPLVTFSPGLFVSIFCLLCFLLLGTILGLKKKKTTPVFIGV